MGISRVLDRFPSLLCSAVLLVGLTSCSWLDALNPFSSEEVSSPAPVEKSASKGALTEVPVQSFKKPQSEIPLKKTFQAAAVPPYATSRPKQQVAPLSSVEITWQVPGEPVDKYILEFGTDSSNLNQRKEVSVKELQKIDHPEQGPLFRYLLKGTDPNKPFFFTVQAQNQYGLSPKSPVQEIK